MLTRDWGKEFIQMELDGMTGRFFRICEVISRLAYLNILWILFTLLGLGIFGIIPATVALFAVIRKWVMGDTDVPIFATFRKIYRKEFLKSTMLGGSLLLVGYILYVDFIYLPSDGIFAVVRFGLMIVSLLFVIILLYIFPLFVHYEWKNRLYIKYALVLGASHPHYTLLMLIGIGVLYFVSVKIPGIIPFFSISLLAYIIMWTSYQVIQKIEATQKIEEEDIEENELAIEES